MGDEDGILGDTRNRGAGTDVEGMRRGGVNSSVGGAELGIDRVEEVGFGFGCRGWCGCWNVAHG